MTSRIEDYAMIGDCETAALVGRDGSIDWLCWPRFDSPACFAALLGGREQGCWRLRASDEQARISRRYRDDTLILETRIETATGRVLVLDFMPPRGANSDLIRIVRGEAGEVTMHTEVILRFGYGAYEPWITRIDERTWRAIVGPDMVTLGTSRPLQLDEAALTGELTVREGEAVSFVLMHAQSHVPPPEPLDVMSALEDTEEFWHEWIGRGLPIERWAPEVRRSLMILRALIYRPTGGILAAPTTSLPERLGGERNWDYRYCWLRDATLTLLAFMDAGYYEEASAWREWLVRAVAGRAEQMQIMYGPAGERRLTEIEADWLPGYQGALPVRLGNAAYSQLQLDVYGEIMDALYQSRCHLDSLDRAWEMQRELLDFLAHAWERPDYGIWEVRGPPRHFTYSKIMCWVAFDRAIKDAERHGLDGPLDEWRAVRERIHHEVCSRGYDRRRNCFVQSYDSDQLDASLLRIIELGFLPPEDPRVQGTIAAIEAELTHDGFVMRYDSRRAADGLPPGEGCFIACSFWLVDAYAMCGRRAEAEALFERLLALCNDVGLLAEEYDPRTGRMLGNFPQALSHLSLVASAFNLSRGERPSEQRSAGS